MSLFIVFCNCIIPLCMLIGGFIMKYHPPKSINYVFGYRTRRSTLSQETWDFAHTCCGKLWIKIGIISLILSVAIQIPFIKSEQALSILTTVLSIAQIVLIIISIIPVERALKRTFDDKGNRKIG